MFRFRAFKVDSFNYEMRRETGILRVTEGIDLTGPGCVFLKMRHPIFVEAEKAYVVGFDCNINVFDQSLPFEDRDVEKNALIRIQAGIVGYFEPQEGPYPKELEEKLVKFQMPALLLPYLRGLVTTFFAMGGYGAAMFPIFNVQKIAGDQLKDVVIQMVSEPTPAS